MSLLPPRHLRRDRRGNVAMMYALALPVLMFAIGLAIDYTHAAQVRTQLNAAADAAVLAALTPSMMQQSNATAQTAATNMFNGQIAGLTSLATGDTTVTVTVANPTGTTLVRNVTVAYSAQNNNIFAGILGAPTFNLAGSSSASASVAANINFYLLLDNSPSMALPATQAGITEMENLTAQQDSGVGCAFACHQALTGPAANGDTQGNSCAKTSGSTTTYTAPTLNSSGSGSGNSYCAATRGTQIDNYQVARNNNITLRLDELSSAVTTLMNAAYTAQTTSTQTTPPKYQFAVFSMDSTYAIGLTQLMGLTSNYVSGWSSASPNFQIMEMYDNNNDCGSSGSNPCANSGGVGDVETNYDDSLGKINSGQSYSMPNPGNGTNVAGDTPQEVLFIVTDGVEDEVNSTCSQPLNGTRCQAPINTSLCTTIKNRNIRIAILYTDYYPVTADYWYNDWIAPFQSSIASNLESCASPGLFYDAGVDSSNLGSDLQTLFNLAVQTAHLTQ
ncbi:MAG: pilus assembly protein TadG-related protein [Roseiarcus sp.]